MLPEGGWGRPNVRAARAALREEDGGWRVVQLEAPVARVCGLDMPFPLIFEPFYVPTADKVDPDNQTFTVRSLGNAVLNIVSPFVVFGCREGRSWTPSKRLSDFEESYSTAKALWHNSVSVPEAK